MTRRIAVNCEPSKLDSRAIDERGAREGLDTVGRDFLHRLPTALDARQRVEFESMGIAIDLIDLAMENLKAGAADIVATADGSPNWSLSRRKRLEMIREAWLIVDQLYALRKLIESAGRSIDLKSSKTFLSSTSAASKLRNYMDHLKDQMGNLVARSSPLAPIHGILTFAFLKPDDLAPPDIGGYTSWQVAMIMGSAMQLPLRAETLTSKYKTIVANGDHFALQAFDVTLDLSGAAARALAFGDDLGTQVEAGFREAASKAGQSADALLTIKAEGAAWIVKVSGATATTD